jgi:hypothetical protein
MTTPVTSQGPATHGMSNQQQGYASAFPPPLGIEQYLGQPQQHGGFPQQAYTQSPFPGQQQIPGQQQVPAQQVAQSLLTQLLPIAHQVILPQVLATAMQQIPVHLQQLVTQVAQQALGQLGHQTGWQQPQFGQQGGWQQQPQFGQQGHSLFARGF